MTRWCGACVGFLLLTLVALCASAASPKRVLILDPFGRDVAPFSAAVSAFRTTLARELGEPVDYLRATPGPGAFCGDGRGRSVGDIPGRPDQRAVRWTSWCPSVAAGMQFAARHRERLFPDTPVLVVRADPRMVPPGFLRTNATLVTQKVNLPGMVEDILQMQPQTTNIVVVFGASALERFWVERVPPRVSVLHQPGGVHVAQRLVFGANPGTVRRFAAALVHPARVVRGGRRRGSLREERSIAAPARGR